MLWNDLLAYSGIVTMSKNVFNSCPVPPDPCKKINNVDGNDDDDDVDGNDDDDVDGNDDDDDFILVNVGWLILILLTLMIMMIMTMKVAWLII